VSAYLKTGERQAHEARGDPRWLNALKRRRQLVSAAIQTRSDERPEEPRLEAESQEKKAPKRYAVIPRLKGSQFRIISKSQPTKETCLFPSVPTLGYTLTRAIQRVKHLKNLFRNLYRSPENPRLFNTGRRARGPLEEQKFPGKVRQSAITGTVQQRFQPVAGGT
jgi:hypothetical protein